MPDYNTLPVQILLKESLHVSNVLFLVKFTIRHSLSSIAVQKDAAASEKEIRMKDELYSVQYTVSLKAPAQTDLMNRSVASLSSTAWVGPKHRLPPALDSPRSPADL